MEKRCEGDVAETEWEGKGMEGEERLIPNEGHMEKETKRKEVERE